MTDKNLKIDPPQLLTGMYSDGYFPDFLVDKIRDILLEVCHEIEDEQPPSNDELYVITCRATE